MPVSILTIVGARPQFVKAAVVSRALHKKSKLKERIVHTGQHFDANMSDVFFDELGIPHPDHHLGIGGGTHGENTGRMIEAIERVLLVEKPEIVLVYGDTDTTLAGALAASKLGIKIAHVESGLRSFNRSMPEEINRIVTDHVSDILFAPSSVSVANLRNEGIDSSKVHFVGDVMFDAVKHFADVAKHKSNIVERLCLVSGSYLLVTLHRKENTDDRGRLRSILRGLSASNMCVVLPLHPRTRRRIEEYEIELPDRFKVIDPIGYLDMMQLESNARAVATDSGGVQKEAYFNGVPCITMRNETEWTELVDIGVNRLVGASEDQICLALEDLPVLSERRDIYGNGDASSKIAEALAGIFS